ncbi:MAG: hypothetical protein K2Y27_34910 [Xanthobacteraceae bacterium]|nr:hypothetical protein [Xanthobacteraceae bacterium]
MTSPACCTPDRAGIDDADGKDGRCSRRPGGLTAARAYGPTGRFREGFAMLGAVVQPDVRRAVEIALDAGLAGRGLELFAVGLSGIGERHRQQRGERRRQDRQEPHAGLHQPAPHIFVPSRGLRGCRGYFFFLRRSRRRSRRFMPARLAAEPDCRCGLRHPSR